MSARRAPRSCSPLALAGCGEKPEPDVSKPTAVTGTLDLARPRRQPRRGHDRRPPGAGRDGHHAARRARVHRPRRARPRAASRSRAGRRPAAVQVGADGRFRARARKLRAARTASCSRATLAGACGPGRSTSRSRGGSAVLDVATAAGSVLAAFGLSGAAGLNAWIPLLAAGLLDRAGQLQLAEPYDAIATTPGLIVLGLLFVLDFVGDKVPAIDSLLHAVGSIVHPASGAIVFAGPTEAPTDVPSIVLFALGAAVAGSLHATRATIRPASTTLTAGAGNPVLSFAEDVSSGGAQRRRGAGAAGRAAAADRGGGRRGAVVAPDRSRPAAARTTLTRSPPCSPSCSQRSRSPARAQVAERPSVVVIMTDDQTYADMAAMPRTRRLIGRAGARFTACLRRLSALLPVARDVPDRPVQPQQRRADEHAAEGRLRGARRRAHALPVWLGAPATAPRTSASTSTATGCGAGRRCRPAGPTGTARSTRARTRCTATGCTRTAWSTATATSTSRTRRSTRPTCCATRRSPRSRPPRRARRCSCR